MQPWRTKAIKNGGDSTTIKKAFFYTKNTDVLSNIWFQTLKKLWKTNKFLKKNALKTFCVGKSCGLQPGIMNPVFFYYYYIQFIATFLYFPTQNQKLVSTYLIPIAQLVTLCLPSWATSGRCRNSFWGAAMNCSRMENPGRGSSLLLTAQMQHYGSST